MKMWQGGVGSKRQGRNGKVGLQRQGWVLTARSGPMTIQISQKPTKAIKGVCGNFSLNMDLVKTRNL